MPVEQGGDAAMVTDKRDALGTLERGDRVCWSSGTGSVWGTVTSVDRVDWRDGVSGPVFAGITVTVRVPHCPAWDKWGWPASEPRTLAKTFRYPWDVERAYAIDAPAAPRPVTLVLGCGCVMSVVTSSSTGHLLAEDVTCPDCGTPQWVTGTRD